MTDAALARVYATDKVGAQICTAMSRAGFAFDAAGARKLGSKLQDLESDARARADAAAGAPIPRGKGGDFSTKGLQHTFFHQLGAPVLYRSDLTGKPSLGVDAMRAYAACADPDLRALAVAVLDARRARKLRKVYIEAPLNGTMRMPGLEPDGRIHPSWLNYGAVSGRWSCQGPNLMTLPTQRKDITIEWGERDGKRVPVAGGIRSLYVARAGHVLVTFDAKQLEMRVAAYASGDPAMIAACESVDLHAANALAIFGDAFTAADVPKRKALRDIAKQAGFAVCYMAEAETVWARVVAEGQNVKLAMVQAMLAKLHRAFHGYFTWQARRLLDTIRTGVVESPILGRRRWLGHEPSPTECANFPIQGGAADIMNHKLPRIVGKLAKRAPRVRLVAQVHDSGVFEAPRCDAACVVDTCVEEFDEPVAIGSSGTMLEARFPIDHEVSERWH